MWHIGFLVWISCLTTLISGQTAPPPQITNFLPNDLIKPDEVKFSKKFNAGLKTGFKLPCDATGSNPLKWTWEHNGSAVVDNDVIYDIQADGSLIGQRLEAENSGNYQCFVEDTVTGKKTFSRKLQVAVTYVEDFTAEGKTDKTVTIDLGQPFSTKCPPHGPNYGAVYTWTNKDQLQFKRAAHRAISPEGELFIMYVTQKDVDEISDFGGINCKIDAANTFYNSGLITLKKRTAAGDPETKQSPSWKVTPNNAETAIEGRSKTLYCFAIGRPAPGIIWKKNGQQIIKGQNSFEIPDAFFGRRLDIVNVKKDDHEDTYTCEAENSENSGRPLTFTIILTVKVAPQWKGNQPPPAKLTIDIKGNGTILCDAIGDPLPTFVWYKNGDRITSSTARVKVDDNKLLFKDVELEDDGIYQCVAESSLGMIVSSTWVNVLAKPPTFSTFGPFYLFEDSEARLKCEPDAAPPPEFRWFKDGKEITIGQAGYRILSDGTLVIDKVTQQDKGQYRCWAKNFLDDAEATAPAYILKKTEIVRKPTDKTVKEGDNVDLNCRATYDSSLEIRYFWKRDDATIVYDSKINWDDSKNILTISDIRVEDAGVYTCVAYTPEPKRSEDTASAIINIQGVPFPPTKLSITADTCINRTTTLRWVTSASNDAPIMHFLVEQESNHEPNVYRLIYNVTNPNATSVTFNLTGWATLRFRMRAVNRLGPSRPSEATEAGVCRTALGKPDKSPDNLRGVPYYKKAEEIPALDIVWTPMPKVDWNAPGLYYILNYRRVRGEPPDKWTAERIPEADVGKFSVPDPGYYKLWEFKILAGNNEGQGEFGAIEQSYSGQDAPEGKPEDVSIGEISARSVKLSWKPVAATKGGSVDGYRIYYWGESRLNARRRRRAIPSYALFTNATGGNTKETTVYGLKPYTNYNLAIKAFNSGGEGPSSDEVTFGTLEAVPGPPSDVNVYAFAEYILVTWKTPAEPNGIITGYQAGSAEYKGSEPKGVTVEKKELGADVRRYLIGDQKELTDYVVEIQAKTSPGWGESVRETARTVKMSAPAKPRKPTVVGTAVDKVKVTYEFGLGGGYTHEFRVIYRKKLAGEESVNTSWVNHFDVQDTEISGLDPDLYEFRTVGKNGLGESPASDITEGRPLPGVAAGQRATTPIHKSAWFIALLVLIALCLLVLILFVLYTKYRGAKYPVGKRERKRAALIDREPYDEEEGPFNNGGAQENPPPYPSQGSLDKRSRESDRDSLDDYGEGPQFNEDGSFIEEYGDEKKTAPDEKDQSAFATFV